jgi:mannose-6-phosphate isomerase
MLPPLTFSPLYRHYLWGGRRFESFLGRQLSEAGPYAESWELVDRGDDQSVVRDGPLAGQRLGDLLRNHPAELLGGGSRPAAFPLLFKFLDAHKVLSVQVHPDDHAAAKRTPPDRGKTEAWYVVEAEPGSRIFAGLREGVDRQSLADAIEAGRCEDLLHAIEPAAGDCIFIPAGTVHAIGAGLVVAEIQQSSDVTYRLFDWNRVGPDGKPRQLHVDAGLEAVTQLGPVTPRRAAADTSEAARVSPLVSCDYFRLDLLTPAGSGKSRWQLGGDDAPHFVSVLSGTLELSPGWKMPPLGAGDCVLLPAALGEQAITGTPGSQALHISLP